MALGTRPLAKLQTGERQGRTDHEEMQRAEERNLIKVAGMVGTPAAADVKTVRAPSCGGFNLPRNIEPSSKRRRVR